MARFNILRRINLGGSRSRTVSTAQPFNRRSTLGRNLFLSFTFHVIAALVAPLLFTNTEKKDVEIIPVELVMPQVQLEKDLSLEQAPQVVKQDRAPSSKAKKKRKTKPKRTKTKRKKIKTKNKGSKSKSTGSAQVAKVPVQSGPSSTNLPAAPKGKNPLAGLVPGFGDYLKNPTYPGNRRGEIGGIGTGRWLGEGKICDIFKVGTKLPTALYIFIDSSGSMNNYYSTAALCAREAAKSAIKQGVKVSIINFSSNLHVVSETSSWRAVINGINRIEGANTILPQSALTRLVKNDGSKSIMIISDGVIHNYKKTIPHFSSILNRDSQNKGYFVTVNQVKCPTLLDYKLQKWTSKQIIPPGCTGKTTKAFKKIGFNILRFIKLANRKDKESYFRAPLRKRGPVKAPNRNTGKPRLRGTTVLEF
ncbi:MAG: VWA domain-containing protein [Candidatus Saganbacteria bacterium]|nr:VWA domain-containing protein [Candidatus Saganbacteria bacterium]